MILRDGVCLYDTLQGSIGVAVLLCFGPFLAMKPLKPTVIITPVDGRRRTIGEESRHLPLSRPIRFGGTNKDFETVMEFKEQNEVVVQRLTIHSEIQTLDQPSSNKIKAGFKTLCCCCESKMTRVENETGLQTRPLYRDDIFYEGDIQQLPEYVSGGAPTNERNFLYQLRVFRVALHRDLQAQCCDCCRGGYLFPNAICRACRSMVDFSFLFSPAFLLMGTGYGFFLCGINIYNSLTFAKLIKHGFSKQLLIYFVSSIGIANTLGRGIAGLLCYCKRFDAWGLVTISMFLSSLAIINIEVCHKDWEVILSGFFYGFTTAPPTALATLLVVDLFGLNNLTGVYGLRQIFCGVGSLVGVPFAVYVNNYFKDDKWSTRMSAFTVFIGSVFLFSIRFCSNTKVN